MYCTYNTVQFLCKNKATNLPIEDVTAAASLVDPMIDAELSQAFYWPTNDKGTDLSVTPPTPIVAVANYLTAALIEGGVYAMNESGGLEAHPWAGHLRRLGETQLRNIKNGTTLVEGLVRRLPIARGAAEQVFSPVGGERG